MHKLVQHCTSTQLRKVLIGRGYSLQPGLDHAELMDFCIIHGIRKVTESELKRAATHTISGLSGSSEATGEEKHGSIKLRAAELSLSGTPVPPSGLDVNAAPPAT